MKRIDAALATSCGSDVLLLTLADARKAMLAVAGERDALQREIKSVLDHIPDAVHVSVREGGGDENLAASLAASMISLRDEYRRLRTECGAWTRKAADRLADEVAVLIRRRTIDARSPAADALHDYRDPMSNDRADRLALAEARADRAENEQNSTKDAIQKYIAALANERDLGAQERARADKAEARIREFESGHHPGNCTGCVLVKKELEHEHAERTAAQERAELAEQKNAGLGTRCDTPPVLQFQPSWEVLTHGANRSCCDPRYVQRDSAGTPISWTLTINEYQRANLLWLLCDVAGYDRASAVFGGLQTGDWLGEIANALRINERGEVEESRHAPNVSVQDLARQYAYPGPEVSQSRARARAWKALAKRHLTGARVIFKIGAEERRRVRDLEELVADAVHTTDKLRERVTRVRDEDKSRIGVMERTIVSLEGALKQLVAATRDLIFKAPHMSKERDGLEARLRSALESAVEVVGSEVF